MTYIQIHKGRGLILLAVAVIVICAWALFRSHPGSHPGSAVFSSCAEAKAKGHSNIPKNSNFYNPALDRDKDGIACE